MSPPRHASSPSPPRFPRVSGDEPVEYLHEQGFYQFSPRERG